MSDETKIDSGDDMKDFFRELKINSNDVLSVLRKYIGRLHLAFIQTPSGAKAAEAESSGSNMGRLCDMILENRSEIILLKIVMGALICGLETEQILTLKILVEQSLTDICNVMIKNAEKAREEAKSKIVIAKAGTVLQ